MSYQSQPPPVANLDAPAAAAGRLPVESWGARLVRWVAVLAAVGLVGFFFEWTVNPDRSLWRHGREQSDYYNRLLDGFMDGHLHMNIEVSPALLSAENPYDPRKRPEGSALHDASYYHGKYYLYFGVAPVVVLMWPYKLITGSDLPLAGAMMVFASVGFLASVGTWLGIRRRYFPRTGVLTTVLGVLALGTVSLLPLLLRRTAFWEMPISAGYAFGMLALYALYRCLHAERTAGWWYALTGLCLGLAVGSRVVYVVAVPVMLVPLFAWGRRARATGVPLRRWIGRAVAGWAPLLAIGVGLATYNWLRFDSPFEFGHRYQLTTLFYEAETRHVSPHFAWFNFYYYFLIAPRWSTFFPFSIIPTSHIPPMAVPAGYYGVEFVAGILQNLPLVWLALLVPLAVWRRQDVAPLRWWLVAAAVFFLCIAGFLMMYYGALARYMIDFLPTLTLLAVVGMLAGERLMAGRPWPGRAAWRLVASVLALYSIAIGALWSLQMYGLLQRHSAPMYARIETLANRLAPWTPKVAAGAKGPVEFELRFPMGKDGRREPLLAVGSGGGRLQAFVEYVDAGRVRFGVANGERVAAVGEPVATGYGASHRLKVQFAPGPQPEASAWTILLDGTIVWQASVPVALPQPEYLSLLHNYQLDARTVDREFSGALERVTRAP